MRPSSRHPARGVLRSALGPLAALALSIPAGAGSTTAEGAAVPTGIPQSADDLAPLRVERLAAPVEIDGDLSDPGWRALPAIERWYETNPGDNVAPAVGNRAWLAYDERFLYVAFDFRDDDPAAIRSPVGDHDETPSTTDYGGLILDATGDAKSAQMFLANAAGIQYDAITHDASGEDSSPDFFWESAGRVTASGWQLEMRIPFTSIRYSDPNPERWGVLLYRNRPRDFRYQYFQTRLPRGRNCFICNVQPVEGLEGLPSGSHWVLAPYVTGGAGESAVAGAGTPLASTGSEVDGGLDFKWVPNPDTVLDATVNPDFSQIESDTALISANERFALFQPERRAFFLEGVDLLSTPFRASYTRTITSPDWGARVTGGEGSSRYTLLVSQDAGGGSVVLPGSNGSELADQDFRSWAAIGRWRRDFGESFASVLYSGREIDGGGSNRVFGPDFRWTIDDHNRVTGQLLWSATETPDRPDLAEEWDGRDLEGHALDVWWQRSDGRWDNILELYDVGDGFRSFNGLVPRVGYRALYGDLGRTFRPESGAFRRVRVFTQADYYEDRDGRVLSRWIGPGIGFDALWNSFVRLELNFDEVRGVERLHRRTALQPTIQIRPGKVLSEIVLEGRIGDEVDFAHDRLGDGLDLSLTTSLRPTGHLVVETTYSRRTLDVTTDAGLSGRLFTARVARVLARYAFSSRSWLRLIAQRVDVDRDVRLWDDEVEAKVGDFGGSLVFAYKLNWQTVLYVGVSDARELDERNRLEPSDRQAFVKVSYALRR